jgi:hypothetical protein
VVKLRRSIVTALVAAPLALILASCNAVLGNEEGHLLPVDGGGPACGEAKKLCLKVCVDAFNPAFGCGADTCETCKLPRTAGYGCGGSGCSVATCFKDFENCDTQDPNGCETDLRKPDNCGSCAQHCDATEYCDSYSAPIRCVPVCPAQSTTCANTRQCVNTLNDIANCGGCGQECPAKSGELPTCNNGQCGVQCDESQGFHLCGGQCTRESVDSCGATCQKCPADNDHDAACVNGACVQNCKYPTCGGKCTPPPCTSTCTGNTADCGGGTCTDLNTVQHCGSCAPCTPLANQSATCDPPDSVNVNWHCTYACNPGSLDCNSNPGCESLNQDPNCGGCNRDCQDATCNNGTCLCDPGRADCDLNHLDCETQLGTSNDCGGCGQQCFFPNQCVAVTQNQYVCVPFIPDGGPPEGGSDSGKDGSVTPDGGPPPIDSGPPFDSGFPPPLDGGLSLDGG